MLILSVSPSLWGRRTGACAGVLHQKRSLVTGLYCAQRLACFFAHVSHSVQWSETYPCYLLRRKCPASLRPLHSRRGTVPSSAGCCELVRTCWRRHKEHCKVRAGEKAFYASPSGQGRVGHCIEFGECSWKEGLPKCMFPTFEEPSRWKGK